MTVQDLYSTITAAQYNANGTLTLPASVFGAGGFQNTVSLWIGTNLVVNAVADVAISGNTVTLNGTMSFLGVQNIAVTGVTFGLVDSNGNPTSNGNPSIFIEFPLPVTGGTPWAFSTSFPLLKGAELDLITYQSAASFLLTSVAMPQGSDYPALAAGLNFYTPAISTSVSPLNVIAKLLNATTSLSGPISVISGSITALASLQPKITITSPSLTAGFLDTSFYLQGTSAPGVGGGLEVELAICASVQIGSVPPIVLSAGVAGGGSLLVLEADLGAAVSYALNDLSSWLGGTSLGSVFGSTSFDLGNDVTVQNVSLFFSTAELVTSPSSALMAVSIAIGTPTTFSWTVIPNYFTLNSINVTFMVNNPLGGNGGPSLTATVIGDVTLVDEITLTAMGTFPSGTFGLSTDAPVYLTQAFEKVGLNLTGFPNLVLEEFEISASVSAGTFGLAADISSDWTIDVGIATIDLQAANIELDYASGTTSGALSAIATLQAKGGSEVAQFTSNWSIPGAFTLEGVFPEISLTDLANTIASAASLSLPSTFPEIDLQNSQIELVVQPGQGGNQPTGTTYDLTLSTTITFGGTAGLDFVAEIVDSGQGSGFVVGIWSENWVWSPADLSGWASIFGTILGGITFSNSGLVISTLPQTSLTLTGAPSNLPQKISQGLTFFTEIGFGTSPLAVLSNFFGNATGIALYAVLADPLTNSVFTAIIGDTTSTSRYDFSGLQLQVTAATETFTIQAGVTFTFTDTNGQDVTIDFVGGGSISMEGEFDIYFVLTASESETDMMNAALLSANRALASGPPTSSPGWVNPLGINGLTIDNFWGEIGFGTEGLQLGFGGDIGVGDVNLELDLVGGFEAEVPYVDVFKFSIAADSPGNSITLTQLVQTFTDLNLSWVPLLSDISLSEFMVAVVLAPTGWTNPATGQLYKAGFYSSGNVTFFGYNIVFDIEIIFQSGIQASGYISAPINLGNGVFVLSDSTGTKGPQGSIDTLALTGSGNDGPYLTLSGSLTLLGMTDTISATITGATSWTFSWLSSNFIFTEAVSCSLENGDFNATASGSLSLDIDTGSGVTLGGYTIIPPIDVSIVLNMTITIAINPGFTFTVTGTFGFGSQTLSVSLTLAITSWSDLKNLLITYFEQYPEQLFGDLVNDVTKWATAIGDKVIQITDDVATVLKGAFNVLQGDAAALLQAAGYTLDEAVQALQNVWDATEEEAEQLVDGVWNTAKKCAVSTAAFFM